MGFKVGMKVVCVGPIGRPWLQDALPTTGPSIGDVCTVTQIISTGEAIYLRLSGWVDFFDYFNSRHFRPIVEKKTDISIFEEIARRASQTGLVDA